MEFLKKLVGLLDKVKIVIKFAKALDAAIDAFKQVIESEKE